MARVRAGWVEGDEAELLLNSHAGGPEDARVVIVLLTGLELFDMARKSQLE